MKYKIIGILICFIVCLLTLIIMMFSITIKIHQPLQLYVNGVESYLIFENEENKKNFENNNKFTITDRNTSKQTVFYKNNKQTEVPFFSNVGIRVKTNENTYKNGWYNCLVFVKSESFFKHYIGI